MTHKSTFSHFENPTIKQGELLKNMRHASKKIAPVWPLENFVAVNPYLGHSDKKFETVAQELATAGDIQMTLPVSFYLQKIHEGQLTNEDLAVALKRKEVKADVEEFLKNIASDTSETSGGTLAPTVGDVVKNLSGKDWNNFMVSRISSWAASYFDNGQATWATADKENSVFGAWKVEAEVDRSTEIAGLKGFRKIVKSLPENPLEASQIALDLLGISDEALPLYLHRLLLRVGGWSAYAARLDWDSELYGGKDGKLVEFLAVLICWEACLLETVNNSQLESTWEKEKEKYKSLSFQKELNKLLSEKLILQEAFDVSAQRKLVNKFKLSKKAETKTERASAQAVFCIDVRSEVFRRNLELADSNIETIGFAGFFAFPINFKPIGRETGEANCPVLLPTGPTIVEEIADASENEKALNSRLFSRQLLQLWKTFKSSAVTCFSYVSPLGLSYLPKLFTDSFGITRTVPHPDTIGMNAKASKKKSVSISSGDINGETVGIPLAQQIEMGRNALNAMSLSENFAPFVLIAGHGSTMVNNPHATGYDCGACGGHSGEANAKVAAEVLNNKAVREGLKKENIFIPEDTTFLACLHDTTTDEVTVYNEVDIPEAQKEAFEELQKSLAWAGKTSRTERSLRLASDDELSTDESIFMRSKDWSQVRPEWGLAGCSAFVVAPRERTKGIDLEGKSFLHSYDWKKDENFSILELIMTAPMVVTSWINLQYYGSTVDNKNYGSGNKTLHNVTAGVGVLEGYSGDLRVGLPLQAIHDGENFQNDPLKLNVVIEAPIDAMNTILEKHQSVRDLCDNGWIHLMAMDENGQVERRYAGDLKWEEI